MTVRNIRAHQSRGLLPPPEVRARTGYYGAEHVARLRLIQELQGNGYNLAAIKDLVTARAARRRRRSRSPARCSPRSRTSGPEIIEAAELAERFAAPTATRRLLRRAEKLGDRRAAGGGALRDPEPDAAARGRDADRPRDPAREGARRHRDVARQADSVADAFVKLFLERVWKPFDRAGQPEPTGPPCSPRSSSCARSPPRCSWRSSSSA